MILPEGVDSLQISARVSRYGNKSKGKVEVIHDNKVKHDFLPAPNQNVSLSRNSCTSVKRCNAVTKIFMELANDCSLSRRNNLF